MKPYHSEQDKVHIKTPSSFTSNILKLLSGSAIAQGIGILSSPILTRLYGPEAFGIAYLFVALTSIIGVVACLRYELAIILPENVEEARDLLIVSLVSVVATSLATALFVWLAQAWLLKVINAPGLIPYLWLMPAVTFFGGITTALRYWNTRTKNFGRQAIAAMVKSGGTAAARLGFSWVGITTGGGLIAGSMFGIVLSTLVLVKQTLRSEGQLILKRMSLACMLSGFKRHYKFPLYSTWAGLLNVVSWQLPAWFLAAFFSPVVVGYYALGDRVIRTPMNFLGNAIAQVFLQRAAQAKTEGNLAYVMEQVYKRLIAIGLLPTILLIILGRSLFEVVFGANWSEAGVYTQILAPFVFFWFVSSPISSLLFLLERQQTVLALQGTIFASRLVALALGGWLGDKYIAMMLYAGSGVIVYGGLSLWLLRIAEVPIRRSLVTLLGNMLRFIPVVGMLLMGKLLWGWSSAVLLIIGLVIIMANSIELARRDRQLRRQLLALIPYRKIVRRSI